MTLPSRKTQSEWLAYRLEKGAEEEEDLLKFSQRIVQDFHFMLTSKIKAGVPFPHQGTVFKSPATTKTYCVAWQEGDYAWFVADDSHFGDFCRTDDPFWKYTEESRSDPARYVKNPDWGIGQKVYRSQGYYHGKIIAVGNKCVLLENLQNGQIQPDSNENMKRYYTREG